MPGHHLFSKRRLAIAGLPLLLVACDMPPEEEADDGVTEEAEQPVTDGPLLEPASRAPKFAEPFRNGGTLYPRWNRPSEVVVICMDGVEGHQRPREATLLADLRTSQRYYDRVSLGKFRPSSVRTFGCGGQGGFLTSPVNKRGTYWEDRARQVTTEVMMHEFRTDALLAAERAGFDFAKYDRNGNREITGDELSVVVVRPYSVDAGSKRETNLALRNVNKVHTVDLALMANTRDQAKRDGLIAHELAHLFFDAGDMYSSPLFQAGDYSIMDVWFRGLNWLDPFHLLKLGWLKPKVQPIQAGNLKIRTIDSSGEVAIFYDVNVRKAEYFIVDVRGVGGVTLWRIVEDEQRIKSSPWANAYAGKGWGHWAIHKVSTSPIPQGGTADLQMTTGQATHRIRVTSPVARGATNATTTIAVEKK